jgi:hypothetical protein
VTQERPAPALSVMVGGRISPATAPAASAVAAERERVRRQANTVDKNRWELAGPSVDTRGPGVLSRCMVRWKDEKADGG